MPDSDMAYIAVEPCGCATACTVDRPEYAREVAKDVAKWLRGGRSIERCTVAEAKERMAWEWPCEHVQGSARVAANQMQMGAR